MSNRCHLVLVLLYLLFHACNARQLGLIHREAAERFHLPNKENEKSSLDRVLDPSNAQQSLPNKFDDAARKENIHKAHGGRAQLKGHGVQSSGASSQETESMASVSWKVPHKREGEQQPGFNLDYSPPKTHPPFYL